MPDATTATIRQIKDSLIELLGAMKATDTARMVRGMEALDAVVAAHRSELDPRLAHFLARRSYAKALDFLGGADDVPAGTCGQQ